MKKQLIKIICMSDEELMVNKMKTRKWAEDKHSFEATSKRLWNKVYGRFF